MAKKQFKSESKRLLDLMINSIYTHKEIFLRELISNASDAIDKLCFIALTDDKLGMTRSDFQIELHADKDSRTVIATFRTFLGQMLAKRQALLEVLYPNNPEIVAEVISNEIRNSVIDFCTHW